MQERLIFPTKIEQEATLELIKKNFPGMQSWDVPDPNFEVFSTDIHIDVDKEYFFEWAVQPQEGRIVLFYCLNLSLELIGGKPWCRNVITKIRYADGRNLLEE